MIQNSQNRDSEAMQLKLDELIRSIEGAHNTFLCLEEMTEEDLERIRKNYLELARKAREKLKKGKGDRGCPDLPEGDTGSPENGDQITT